MMCACSIGSFDQSINLSIHQTTVVNGLSRNSNLMSARYVDVHKVYTLVSFGEMCTALLIRFIFFLISFQDVHTTHFVEDGSKLYKKLRVLPCARCVHDRIRRS